MKLIDLLSPESATSLVKARASALEQPQTLEGPPTTEDVVKSVNKQRDSFNKQRDSFGVARKSTIDPEAQGKINALGPDFVEVSPGIFRSKPL